MIAPKIDANLVWRNDVNESIKLYRQFVEYFKGDLKYMLSYYGWKKQSLVKALRYGRTNFELKT